MRNAPADVARPFRFSFLRALVAVIVSVAAGSAHADELRRPRLEVGIGLGTEIDRNWPDATHDARPLSLGTGAIVGRCVGVQLGASGMTRTALGGIPSRERADLLALVRPIGCLGGVSDGYARRVARSLTAGAGFGLERLSEGMNAAWRTGVAVSAQIDLPLVAAAYTAQPALRFGVRRFLGFERRELAGKSIGDTAAQVYGAFVLAF